MIRVVSALVTLLLSAAALSRPVVLQSTETILSPDPTYTYFGNDLAIDGDWAIVTASGEGPEAREYEIRCVREDGHWRVVLELPPLSPIQKRVAPDTGS